MGLALLSDSHELAMDPLSPYTVELINLLNYRTLMNLGEWRVCVFRYLDSLMSLPGSVSHKKKKQKNKVINKGKNLGDVNEGLVSVNGNINDIHYLYLWNFQRKILINKIFSYVANKYTKHIREDKIFK